MIFNFFLNRLPRILGVRAEFASDADNNNSRATLSVNALSSCGGRMFHNSLDYRAASITRLLCIPRNRGTELFLAITSFKRQRGLFW